MATETEKKPKLSKQHKLPKADLMGLSSAMHAAVALANASGEPLPKALAQSFNALLMAELMAVAPVSKLEETLD